MKNTPENLFSTSFDSISAQSVCSHVSLKFKDSLFPGKISYTYLTNIKIVAEYKKDLKVTVSEYVM